MECSIEDCCEENKVKGLCDRHYKRLWYLNNKDLVLSRRKDRYNRDKTRELEYSKLYAESNRQSTRLHKTKWREANPEHIKSIRDRRRHSADLGMTDQDKIDSIAWRIYIKDRPCAYCFTNSAVKHYDHLQPLSRSGTDHWFNIVRTCQTCNLSKNSKTVREFMTGVG